MKQKNKSDELARKKDLKVLEQSLREDMRVLENSLRTEIKLSAEEILTKVDENAQGYRDQILTSNDKLAKQLETIREDLEIGNFQTEEKIKDHEKRIKNLEKIQPVA